jgi:hypothetical protein
MRVTPAVAAGAVVLQPFLPALNPTHTDTQTNTKKLLKPNQTRRCSKLLLFLFFFFWLTEAKSLFNARAHRQKYY